jgi:hypothetical protein
MPYLPLGANIDRTRRLLGKFDCHQLGHGERLAVGG